MIHNIKTDIELSSFYVIFDGSTMVERKGWYGMSHLIEHLVCKGFEYLQDELQRYGITWNAYTSNNEVVFYIKGLDEYVNKYKYKILEGILSYNPTLEELEKEKKIVLEEYKDSFNDQITVHYYNLYRKLYGYYCPIGLRTDIQNFTLEDLKEYMDLYCKNPTKIINVSKNNDFNINVKFREGVKLTPFKINVNDVFLIKNENDIIPENLIPLELINDYKTKSSIINISPVITDDFAIVSFICDMLGSGLNSPLYKEIREKLGLSYYIRCKNVKHNNISSSIFIYSETSNENVDLMQEKIGEILSNKEKFLTKERFEIVKDNRIVKIKENNILKHNDVTKYIEPESWNIENLIYNLNLDIIYSIYDKYFKWDAFYKSVYNQEFKN